MALIKDILQPNAVTMSYHRIVSINKITNKTNIVEVCSYINEHERERYDILWNNQEHITVLTETTFIELPYDEDMTIKDAYRYIAENVEPFIGAEDDI